MSGKRTRDDKMVKRAMAIGAKINAAYPYSDYGRAYFKRGTPENLERFGATYKAANAAQRATRKSVGYIGRGRYSKGRGGYWMQKLFGAKPGGWLDKLGDSVASVVPGGDMIAGGTAALHQAVTGGGLYMGGKGLYMGGRGSYGANDTIAGSGQVLEAPRFTPQSDGGTGVMISHREYVCDIFGPDASNSAFSNQTWSLNPGVEKTFPWLSQIALNYEEYELVQCIFTYKSTTTDTGVTANGQVGTIVMATQYDVDDEPFIDKDTMLRYALAESTKMTEHQIHGVECDPRKNSGSSGKYVRNQPVKANEDLKDYDHGVFNLAICNCPQSFQEQAVGELWVSYTVRLRKPKIAVSKAFNVQRDNWVLSGKRTGAVPGTTGEILQNGPLAVGGPGGGSGGVISPFLLANINNSIGCKLAIIPGPGGNFSDQLQITFPAQYSGNVKIRFKMDMYKAVKLQFSSGQFGNNIRPILDIPKYDAATSSYVYTSSLSVYDNGTPLAADTNQVVFEQHVQVGIATGGQNNVQTIFWEWLNPTLPGEYIMMQMLDIEEYNTTFNYKQKGNDALMLVDEYQVYQSPVV